MRMTATFSGKKNRNILTHTKWHIPNTDHIHSYQSHGEVPPKRVYWTTGKLWVLMSNWTGGSSPRDHPPNPRLPRHPPDSRDTTFRGTSFLIYAEKKCQNLKRSPHISRSTLICGWPSSCVPWEPQPPTLSRVACALPPECLASYSPGVVGAQIYLGKVLFCLETLLPTSPYPLWFGRARCRGEVSQIPTLLPSPSPPFSTPPSPCPPLPCAFHTFLSTFTSSPLRSANSSGASGW